jgi:hypothetical protein
MYANNPYFLHYIFHILSPVQYIRPSGVENKAFRPLSRTLATFICFIISQTALLIKTATKLYYFGGE